jgi:hypothetical protein
MDIQELIRLLVGVHALDVAEAEKAYSETHADCIMPSRMWALAYDSSNWTEAEREHVASCPACTRMRGVYVAHVDEVSPLPASPTAEAESVFAQALGGGDADEQQSRRWDITVFRRHATRDVEPAADPDATADITLQWRDFALQVRLSGFLQPDPGQTVRIVWEASDNRMLAQGTLSTGESNVVRLASEQRGPDDGDRLCFEKRDAEGNDVLKLETRFEASS